MVHGFNPRSGGSKKKHVAEEKIFRAWQPRKRERKEAPGTKTTLFQVPCSEQPPARLRS